MIRLPCRVDPGEIAGREPAVRVGRLLAHGRNSARPPAAPRTRKCPSAPRCSRQRLAVLRRSAAGRRRPPARPERCRRARRDRRAARPCPRAKARSSPSSSARSRPSRRSIRAIRAGGIGVPPTTTRSSVGTSPPAASRCSTRPSQTVGTPTAIVTASCIDQPREAGAVGMAAGQDQLRPHRGHGEGQAPGIGVEHRHRRQHAVRALERHHVRLQRAQGVEVAGAVRVGDALGRAGRARGEAEPAGRILLEIAPGDLAARRRRAGGSSAAGSSVGRRSAAAARSAARLGRDILRERGEIGAGDEHARLGLGGHRRRAGRR